MHLIVDQAMYPMLLGEALNQALLVQRHSSIEVAGYADVQCTVSPACQDVDAGVLGSMRHDTQIVGNAMLHRRAPRHARARVTCMGPGLVPLARFASRRRRDDVALRDAASTAVDHACCAAHPARTIKLKVGICSLCAQRPLSPEDIHMVSSESQTA